MISIEHSFQNNYPASINFCRQNQKSQGGELENCHSLLALCLGLIEKASEYLQSIEHQDNIQMQPHDTETSLRQRRTLPITVCTLFLIVAAKNLKGKLSTP